MRERRIVAVAFGPRRVEEVRARFRQWRPGDGSPSTQKTVAYLGYDSKNLYVVFVCFDTEPGKIRAHLTRRDQAFNDDFVDVWLDTFGAVGVVRWTIDAPDLGAIEKAQAAVMMDQGYWQMIQKAMNADLFILGSSTDYISRKM